VTLGSRIGVGAAVVLLLAVVAALWFLWRRPLTVYAMMNRRSLAKAGLAELSAASSVGPQGYWTGGSGQTLVLLHGAGDSAGTYASAAGKLLAKHRLVVPDLAGHGHSAPATGPISIGDVVTGLEAVMKQGPQDPAIIAGNSLGAWAALLYARAHPDRVARIVLVNGGALVGDRPDLSLMPKTRAEAAALMAQLQDPKSPAIAGWVLDDVVREAQHGPIARLSQTAAEMDQYVLEGKLHEIAAPVDMLWGESDRLFPVGYARRMMAQLQASRLTTIPGCGHVPQQECPARFAAALLDVLAMAPPLPESKNAQAAASGAPERDGR
jgi:pimeloyl-ACP methyl ester carboxylesterase